MANPLLPINKQCKVDWQAFCKITEETIKMQSHE